MGNMASQAGVYHLGLAWVPSAEARRADTCYLFARRNIDYLPCELCEYIGRRVTTKAALKAHRADILAWANARFGRSFARLVID